MEFFFRSFFFISLFFFTVFAQLDTNDDPATNIQPAATNFLGSWEIASPNSGVSAMHMQLLPNNKMIMFDASVFGPSQIQLAKGNCNPIPWSKTKQLDCWAHAVEYDIQTSAIRPLKVQTDPWCSSGGLTVDGRLVSTGGWFDGGRSVRYLSPCPTCDFKEYTTALTGERWYSSQAMLPDGSFILIGGRRMFNYEYVPKEGQSNKANYALPFLLQTTDLVENNLYPFVHLSPDGNVFILANNRSILLNPKTNTVVRELPVLPGGSRNYPASGSSVLIPIMLKANNPNPISADVLVCGGSTFNSFSLAEKNIHVPALQDCARIQITNPNAQWKPTKMPLPRLLSDMLILPTGDVLIINGAAKGAAGWGFADAPVFAPVIYRPGGTGQQYQVLNPTNIVRVYHSTAAVLPDGKILVAGSNTNDKYYFKNVKFPTELRIEKFSPPYLDPKLAVNRPEITPEFTATKLKYNQKIIIPFKLAATGVTMTDIHATMYAPPFTTHGCSMQQRLLILATTQFTPQQVTVLAPPVPEVAPPGYYIIYLVCRGVPSPGVWVQIM